jgi:hypothetical protein
MIGAAGCTLMVGAAGFTLTVGAAGCTLTVKAARCTLMVRAARGDLVGAGGVLGLCLCSSRYTLAAWALPLGFAL